MKPLRLVLGGVCFVFFTGSQNKNFILMRFRYYYFLTTATLLRFQNTLILNSQVKVPFILTQNYSQVANFLMITNSVLGEKLVRLFYSSQLGLYTQYRVRLKLVGNGYYLQTPTKNSLILFSGQSHLNHIKVPSAVQVLITGRKKRVLVLVSTIREVIQNFAAFLVNMAYPDVYRLKGLRYVKQTLPRKEGKKKFV